MIVADSDVLIDFFEDRPPLARLISRARAARELATTAVSRYEVLVGAESPEDEARFRAALDLIKTLPLDAEGAARAATVRRDLRSRGSDIGMADSLIAGIVLAMGGELLTRNRKHFERVPGLVLAALPGETA